MELPDDVEDERAFRECIEENLGTETMESVDDLWAVPNELRCTPEQRERDGV